MTTCLVVFAKAPVAGQAKTRLIPALGAEGAARLARRLLLHALSAAGEAAATLGPDTRLVLCGAPEPENPAWSGIALPAGWTRRAQVEGDLGTRMLQAFGQAMADADDVLLFGTDGPQLDAARLVQAAHALRRGDAVLQPATDGGYLLLGLNARLRDAMRPLFQAMPWSTDQVARLTLQRLDRLGARVEVLEALADIDEPADLVHVPLEWLA